MQSGLERHSAGSCLMPCGTRSDPLHSNGVRTSRDVIQLHHNAEYDEQSQQPDRCDYSSCQHTSSVNSRRTRPKAPRSTTLPGIDTARLSRQLPWREATGKSVALKPAATQSLSSRVRHHGSKTNPFSDLRVELQVTQWNSQLHSSRLSRLADSHLNLGVADRLCL
jgi:hypothetical protein